MIYLYGLLPGGEARQFASAQTDIPDGVTGPVRLVDAGSFTLICGAADDAEIAPKRRLLLAHARILEALSEHLPVLPMRFGMTAPDLDTVAGMLDEQATVLRAAFDEIAGKSEFGLRVDVPRDAALRATIAAEPALAAERDRLAAGRPGMHAAADFGHRLAERLDRRRQAAQRALIAALRDHWSRHVLRVPETDVQVLAVDVLISAGTETALAEAVDAAVQVTDFAAGAEPQVRLVGPAPPYSFVDIRLPSPGREAA